MHNQILFISSRLIMCLSRRPRITANYSSSVLIRENLCDILEILYTVNLANDSCGISSLPTHRKMGIVPILQYVVLVF